MEFIPRSLHRKRMSISAGMLERILAVPLITAIACAGCQTQKAALPAPAPEVEVAKVVQQDVPIYGEWVATLDGYVNAIIQPSGDRLRS
jgi:hypothetical protein